MSNGEHEIRTPKGLRIGNRSVVDGKNMLQIKRGGCEDYISAESLVECIHGLPVKSIEFFTAENTHDAFCKTVIRHAAIDAARSIRSRRKREISLEYLIGEKHYPFSTTEKYFAEQSGMTSYPLFVCGQMVLLESPELAAALSALSQMEQEIIFLYYFQRLTHREIGRRYGRAGNTTGRRIQMILRRLRAELEGLSYEPATSL